MKFILTTLCSLILVTGWGQKIKDRTSIPSNSLVYTLPSSVIEVTIEVIEDHHIAGPYSQYADAYLSIEDVPMSNSISYSLGEIQMKHRLKADYDQLYYLPIGSKNVQINQFSLSEQGLIFTSNDRTNIMTFADMGEGVKPYQLYPDRLPSSPMETKKKSNYDRIKTDKGFVQAPYQYSVVNAKDPEKKAEEASKFIYSLRQRRFELITGDVENAFNGQSMQAALDEIRSLEAAYLALFIGKSTLKYRVYTFYITPDDETTKQSFPVCRFSEANGMLSETNKNGRPITLDITPQAQLKDKEFTFAENKGTPTLYYRIPDVAKVQLMDDTSEVCNAHFPIYQLGKIIVLPSDAVLK